MGPLYQDLKFAKVDIHRMLRRNFPEVIYAQGKTLDQIVAIARTLKAHGQPVVITKVGSRLSQRIRRQLPEVRYFPKARMAVDSSSSGKTFRGNRGFVPVVTAGTSDIPIAEEVAVTLTLMGHRVQRLFDVGVAGIHRTFRHLSLLRRADAIVVVAGMDGALPSVISGLVGCPVVAVPTSVGYGASFKGMAALLTMLNSCSPGVAVVNIDNGFGAGYLAGIIVQRR